MLSLLRVKLDWKMKGAFLQRDFLQCGRENHPFFSHSKTHVSPNDF